MDCLQAKLRGYVQSWVHKAINLYRIHMLVWA